MSDAGGAPLRVALLQHASRGDRDANLAHIATQARAAADAGARLLVLQELHNGHYFCQQQDPELFRLAEPLPGPTSDRLGELARELALVIVGSVFEHRAPGLCHNTAFVVERDGRLAGRYRKMHVPEDPGYHEKFYFTPGDLGFVPVPTSVGRLGVLVCWDQWFPEAARLQTLAGADMLIYPSAIGWDPADTPAERVRQLDAWRTVQRGHAVANGSFVLTVNRCGRETAANGVVADFWGHSFVAGPQGEMLAEADAGEALLLADLDPGRVEQVRRIWPFLRDRRIDAYQGLTERLCEPGNHRQPQHQLKQD